MCKLMQLLLTILELFIDFVTPIAGQLSGQHLAYFNFLKHIYTADKQYINAILYTCQCKEAYSTFYSKQQIFNYCIHSAIVAKYIECR